MKKISRFAPLPLIAFFGLLAGSIAAGVLYLAYYAGQYRPVSIGIFMAVILGCCVFCVFRLAGYKFVYGDGETVVVRRPLGRARELTRANTATVTAHERSIDEYANVYIALKIKTTDGRTVTIDCRTLGNPESVRRALKETLGH